MDEPEFVQDAAFPPGWFGWHTGGPGESWHVRPPGRPDPTKYIHGETKDDCADKAWHKYRVELDAKENA